MAAERLLASLRTGPVKSVILFQTRGHHAMSEFTSEHTPDGLDEFTQGYLDAAEWLLENSRRDKINGWTKEAIACAKRVCEAFQKMNAVDLALYEEATGRGMGAAGHDFWLTRNHHGAGFWDRELLDPDIDPAVLTRLTKASHACGEVDAEVYRGWIGFL
jgi:hypothetical protein